MDIVRVLFVCLFWREMFFDASDSVLVKLNTMCSLIQPHRSYYSFISFNSSLIGGK